MSKVRWQLYNWHQSWHCHWDMPNSLFPAQSSCSERNHVAKSFKIPGQFLIDFTSLQLKINYKILWFRASNINICSSSYFSIACGAASTQRVTYFYILHLSFGFNSGLTVQTRVFLYVQQKAPFLSANFLASSIKMFTEMLHKQLYFPNLKHAKYIYDEMSRVTKS